MERQASSEPRVGGTPGKAFSRSRFELLWEAVRRAFLEFLTIPTLVILGFLALGVLAYYLDKLRIEQDWPSFVPGTHESVSTLLGTIAGSIITVTSITFSLLLIAVQQGAAALTGQVYDQFLRRRSNQAYFGFFIGLALYCLIILATVRPDYTPVIGAAVAFGLTVIALYLLIILIYSTIDQMRPVMIIDAIRDHALNARKLQRPLLEATSTATTVEGQASVGVAANESGFLTRVDAGALRSAAGKLGAAAVLIAPSVGDYVSRGEQLCEVRFAGAAGASGEQAAEALLACFALQRQRDLGSDAAFGINQLSIIGWTSVSTSKSNPQPGLLACWALRDLAAHWFGYGASPAERSSDELAIVYTDNVPNELLAAFESLAVVASESLQHQTLAEIYSALAFTLPELPPPLRAEVANIVLRSLSALGEHVLTGRLEKAIDGLAAALDSAGQSDAAVALRNARDRLKQSVGTLHSRANRGGK